MTGHFSDLHAHLVLYFTAGAHTHARTHSNTNTKIRLVSGVRGGLCYFPNPAIILCHQQCAASHSQRDLTPYNVTKTNTNFKCGSQSSFTKETLHALLKKTHICTAMCCLLRAFNLMTSKSY